MEFDELLKRLWMFDAEVFAHDSLFVFISYHTKERVVFHNCSGDEIQRWIDKEKPILMGYNVKGYDKYILKGWLVGMSPEELKKVNDFIINGGNGWDIDMGYVELPTFWDLMDCIKTFKSLKEIEGNLRLNITETTIPFDLPTKWTQQEYEEVLYYCTCDVEALFPLFDRLINRYKSKFIIAKLGKMDYEYALSLTDANLTAKLLGAKKKEHHDQFAYIYPDVIDKSKIPKQFINRVDDYIAHPDDYEYVSKLPPVKINFKGGSTGYVNLGGIHIAKPYTFCYTRNGVNNIDCE